MKDYLVEFKIKNNRLKHLMRERGLTSVRELAAFCGVHDQAVYKLLNLKHPGRRRDNGDWRPVVLKMADRLHCLPEEIVPPQHEDHPLAKNKAELEISFDEIEGLLTAGSQQSLEDLVIEKEEQANIPECLNCLGTSDRTVIELRYGLRDGRIWSLDEVGAELGVSRERIRQREMRALATLRSNQNTGKLLDFKPLAGPVRDAIGSTPERNR